MHRKYLFLIYLILNNICLVSANATEIDIAGGTVSVTGDNHQIEMVSEQINIVLKRERYDIDVEYSFYNHNDDISLNVGFPQWFYGSTLGAEYNLNDFKYYVENKPVTYTIVPIRNDNPNNAGFEINFKQWYYTNVTFPKNKIIKIKNSYNCPYGVSGPYGYADYLYGTGKNWYNQIGTIQINLTIDESIWISLFRFSKTFKYEYEQVKRNQYKIIMKEVEPEPADTIMFFFCIRPFWEIPLNSLFGYDPEKGEVLADKELTSDDLQFLSLNQLKLYKIFYSHVENPSGQIDSRYKEYFTHFIDYLKKNMTDMKNYKYTGKNISKINDYILLKMKYE